MIAGRAVDEEDVKNILIKSRHSIDLKYIKNWLSKLGKVSEHEEILRRFDRLLKR